MPDFSTLDKAGQDAFLGQLQSLPAHLNTNPGGDSLWVLEQPPAPLGSSTTFMTDPDGLFTQLRTFVLEQVSGQDFSQA